MCTVCYSDRLLEGGVSAQKVSAQGDVCLGSVCLGGVSAWGGCLPRGVSARYPPVNRMTDGCKNITLPQLRCGR